MMIILAFLSITLEREHVHDEKFGVFERVNGRFRERTAKSRVLSSSEPSVAATKKCVVAKEESGERAERKERAGAAERRKSRHENAERTEQIGNVFDF